MKEGDDTVSAASMQGTTGLIGHSGSAVASKSAHSEERDGEPVVSDRNIDSSIFDEFDPNDDAAMPLRTLIHFTICKRDSPQEMLDMDEIECNRGNVLVRGVVIEPLAVELREMMVSLLSTTHADPDQSDVQNSSDANLPIATPLPQPQRLDWEALKAGDVVDGYCHKTCRWYETKIILVDTENARYKVHFQGWNSKYDEWIAKHSDRLVPHKTSQSIMQAAQENASHAMPWFDCANLLSLCAQRGAAAGWPAPTGLRREVSVEIDDVEDWCVDYSYANPTLWLVTQRGVWYRLAGALVPLGGARGVPSEAYRTRFQDTLEKYLVSAHTAMAVLDVLPVLPNAGLAVVAEEVQARTGGRMNELHLLEHSHFLAEQLKDIEMPENWSKRASIEKSTFFNQLMKEGEGFAACGGMYALKNNTYKGAGMKRRISLFQELTPEGAPHTPYKPRVAMPRTSLSHNEAPSTTKKKESKVAAKLSYPAEDTLYWQTMHRTQEKPLLPWPAPQHSPQLLDPLTCGTQSLSTLAKFALQEQFLTVYACLSQFRLALQLPLFSLFDLQRALLCDSNSNSGVCVVPNLLRIVCVQCLEKVLEERAARGELKDFFGPAAVFAEDEDEKERERGTAAEDEENDQDAPLSLSLSVTATTAPTDDSVITQDALTNPAATATAAVAAAVQRKEKKKKKLSRACAATALLPLAMRTDRDLSTSDASRASFASFLREGDAWAEALRWLVEDEHAQNVPGAAGRAEEDPRLLCDALCDEIDALLDLSVFAHNDVLSCERSVSVWRVWTRLKRRLKSGWYEERESESDEDDENERERLAHSEGVHFVSLSPPRRDHSYGVGQCVDLFHTALRRWVEAVVVSKTCVRERDGDVRASEYVLRCIGWGAECDERVAVDSQRIVPHKAASADEKRCMMSPEELLSKFPMYENVVSELCGDSEDERETESEKESSRRGGPAAFAADVSQWLSNSINTITSVNSPCEVSRNNQVETEENVLSERETKRQRESVRERVLSTLRDISSCVSLSLFRVVSLSRGAASESEREIARFAHTSDALSLVRRRFLPQELLASQLRATTTQSASRSERERDDLSLTLVCVRWRESSLSALSLADKVQLLYWLVSQLVDTSFARESVTSTRAAWRESIEKPHCEVDLLRCLDVVRASDRERDGDAEDEDNEDERESETEREREKEMRKRRLSNSANATSATPAKRARESAHSQSTPHNKRESERETVSARDAAFEVSLSLSPCEALGRDRFGNAYFVCESDPSPFPLLLCEMRATQRYVLSETHTLSPYNSHTQTHTGKVAKERERERETPAWVSLSDERDLRRLLDFLDEKGQSESRLLKNLLVLLTRRRVSLSQRALTTAESDSTTEGVLLPHTPHNSERERERENERESGVKRGRESARKRERDRESEKERESETTTLSLSERERAKLAKRVLSLFKKKRTPKTFVAIDYEIVRACREARWDLCVDRWLCACERETESESERERAREEDECRMRLCERHALTQHRDFLWAHTLCERVESESFETPSSAWHTHALCAQCMRASSACECVTHSVVCVEFSTEDTQLGVGVKAALNPLTQRSSVYVTSVRPLSLAERAGLRVGDCVVSARETRVESVATLQSVLREFVSLCAREKESERQRESERERDRESVRLTKRESAQRERERERDAAARTERQWLLLVVRRAPRDELFRDLCERDGDVQCALAAQRERDALRERETHTLSKEFHGKSEENTGDDRHTMTVTKNSALSPTEIVEKRMGGLQRLFDALCALCLSVDHAACTSFVWRTQRLPQLLYNVASQTLTRSSADCESAFCGESGLWCVAEQRHCMLALCHAVGRAALSLERELSRCATVLCDAFCETHSAVRRQWRALCVSQSALCGERLAHTLALLRGAVDRALFCQSTLPLTGLPAPLSLATQPSQPSHTPHNSHTTQPALTIEAALQQMFVSRGLSLSSSVVRQRVAQWALSLREARCCVYSTRAHCEALSVSLSTQQQQRQRERETSVRRRCAVWGETVWPRCEELSDHTHTAACEITGSCVTELRESDVWLCAVKSVRVFNARVPFAQVTLTTLSHNAVSPPPAIAVSLSLSLPQQRLAISRKLQRILALLRKFHDTLPFEQAVDSHDYPDYYALIKKPMDLQKIERKIQANKYADFPSFLADLRLMAQNCEKYNGAEDEVYVPVIQHIVRDAISLCEQWDASLCESAERESVVEEEAEEEVCAKRTRRSHGGLCESVVSCAPATTLHSAVPLKTFTVCVRLDADAPSFLVDYDTYCEALSQYTRTISPEMCVVSKTLSTAEQGPSCVKIAKGIVTALKPMIARDGCVPLWPWGALSVDWTEPADALVSSQTNLWDVQMIDAE